MQLFDPLAPLYSLLPPLEGEKSLLRIDDLVESPSSMTLLAEQEQKSADGGKALLFCRVRGGTIPVLMNLFGSPHRIGRLLGLPPGGDPADLTRRSLDSPLRERPTLLPPPAGLVRRRDLADLPPLVSWEGDGAPFTDGSAYTLAVTTLLDPDTDRPVTGIYRVVRFSDSRLGICWKGGSSGDRIVRRRLQRNLPMPVAILFAPPPAVLVAASLSLPPGFDKMELAGGWAGRPVPLFPAPETGIPVPLGTPLIVEGVVDLDQSRPGGGYYNHTGLFEEGGLVPLVRVRSVTMGDNPVIPQTVVAPPPTESTALARAGWRLKLPLIQQEFPEIVDIHLPPEGIWHGAAVISLRETRASGGEILHALWRSPFFSHSRLLILVDEGTPPDDLSRVFWRVMNRSVLGRDLVIADPGDPASTWGGTMGIDARGLPPGRT